MTTISTRVARPLVVALAAAGIPVAATASSALSATASTTSTTSTTATPYCGITWGSLPKAATPMVTGPLTGVRAGRHACYDRLVLDVAGRAPGYTVRYVDTVYTDGAGMVVPLRGGAKLSLVANAPAYTASGNPSFLPANRAEVVVVTGYVTLRHDEPGRGRRRAPLVGPAAPHRSARWGARSPRAAAARRDPRPLPLMRGPRGG
jgi:hypothetical protein